MLVQPDPGGGPSGSLSFLVLFAISPSLLQMRSASVAACGLITVFSDRKVCKLSSQDVQQPKKVLFCLSEDTDMLEEGEEVLVGDAGQTSRRCHATLVNGAATQGCNATCETREVRRGTWEP